MIVMIIIAFFIIFYVLIYQKRFLAQKNAAKEKELSFKKDLLKAVISTEEKERRRIAANLHDELGALLNTARMSLSDLQGKLNEPVLLQKTENAQKLTLQAIECVRHISNDLSSPVLQRFGLVSAINEIVDSINQLDQVNISFFSDCEIVKLEPDSEVQLYRLVKELLNNLMKHARPEFVSVELHTQNLLEFKIFHDGDGLTQEKYEELRKISLGNGLSNLQTRIDSIEGTLRFSQISADEYEILLILPHEGTC